MQSQIVDMFNLHLDTCPQCRDHPFDLCPEGALTLGMSAGAARDMHARTAAIVLGIKPEEVTEETRRAAKAVNFGSLYGPSGQKRNL